jgi:uncharacterized protein YcgI (DUF1989 family)
VAADLRVAQRTIIPPAGYLALAISAGERLRIVDLEGQQVTDLVSFSRADPRERLAMYPSRAVNKTWRLTAGHTLHTTRSREMWLIEEDTVGENYAGGGFCNAYINEKRYGVRDAPNCFDNFIAALAPFGLGADDFDFETCFNVFMTIAYEPEGRWEIREPKSRAGDYIQFRALMDQVVAISNCPQLLNPCNAYRLKPVEVQVLAGVPA